LRLVLPSCEFSASLFLAARASSSPPSGTSTRRPPWPLVHIARNPLPPPKSSIPSALFLSTRTSATPRLPLRNSPTAMGRSSPTSKSSASSGATLGNPPPTPLSPSNSSPSTISSSPAPSLTNSSSTVSPVNPLGTASASVPSISVLPSPATQSTIPPSNKCFRRRSILASFPPPPPNLSISSISLPVPPSP